MLGSIQFFRFWAIVMIALFHAFRGIGIADNGFLFVELFFIVSGYFIMESQKKSNSTIMNFVWKRFLRLYPVFLVSNILYFIIGYYYGRDFSSVQIRDTILFLSYSPFSTNIPLISWFCSALFWSSVVLIIILHVFQKIRHQFVVTLLLSILLYAYILYTTSTLGGISHVYWGFLLKGFLRGIAGVCLGAALSCFKTLSEKYTFSYLQFFEIIAIAAFVYMHFGGHSVLTQILYICVSIALTFLCYQNKTYLIRKLNNGVSIFLGKITFSIYLSHTLYISIIRYNAPSYFDQKIHLLTYLPAIFVIGMVFFACIESPITRYLGKRFENIIK